MTKREIYRKITNLNEKQLDTQNDKNPFVRNDIVTTIIKYCNGEKKEA